MLELFLDASALEIYEPCPRKYEYSTLLNLVPAKAHRAFDIGSYYHDVLQYYYSSPLQDTARLRATFEYLLKPELLKQFNLTSLDEIHFHRGRLTDYFNRWWDEDSTMEVIAVEKGFAYLVYEDTDRRYILEGKIDLIARCAPYGYIVMDHKTQSRKDDRYPLNHQVMNYMNYITNHSPLKKADYFVYNYIGLQDKLPPDGLRRQIYQPYPGMLAQWESEVKIIFDSLYERTINNRGFNRNRSACSTKYGVCHYHKLCMVPDGQWQNAVMSHYKVRDERWKAW